MFRMKKYEFLRELTRSRGVAKIEKSSKVSLYLCWNSINKRSLSPFKEALILEWTVGEGR
jgi:hypothetical protein